VDESLGPDRPSRVYLARKETQHRRLVNGAEIEATLAAHGFVRHDLADLPFVEQLRIVRGADHVIGPSGSALLTCIFGRPGLRIGALMPPGATDVAWLNEVSRSRGFSLSVIYGTMSRPHERYPWMSDYDIDPGSLADYLGREVREPPQPPDVRVSP
jgi:capsular polysaccharide biosynthesis protein